MTIQSGANRRPLSQRRAIRPILPQAMGGGAYPDCENAPVIRREVRPHIASERTASLEEELISIFAATPHQRNRAIVIGYYGWEDGKTHTLAEIGARHGMTRERTRQICAKLTRRADPASIAAPVCDRVLAMVAEQLPAPVAVLEQKLRSSGLTVVGLGLSHIETAARLLGRPVPFALVDVGPSRLAVRPDHAQLPAAVIELARREAYYRGLASLAQLLPALRNAISGQVDEQFVRVTLALVSGFHWLDEPAGWFRFDPMAQHGLPKTVEKILSVAPEIDIDQLRSALARHRRMWPATPSPEVLLEFCRHLTGVRVVGRRVTAIEPRDWREVLTGVEQKLVDILQRHGPVMERSQLEDLCVREGMNRFSFHAFIACSPVIAQYGHSLYGLLGASVTPEMVRQLLDKRKAERSPSRVLDGHGSTDDGKIWLSYRLSRAASTYAVITVPAALKQVVSGRFDLLADDGRQVGKLAAKDGRAWGLGAYLRKQHARADDRIRLIFDLDRRTAVVELNQDSATQPKAASPPLAGPHFDVGAG
ncbi:MAG: hypothetical protein KJZ87_07815 [Thermoguttaceae bacterium]|nr:hypothetical protein [Thermoguttaceae bacterium]